ncbi:unnamed protein product [Hymenolepis diminuta]|uniref:Uncharacterized protein n=1 Tax=Hymenolepis diminuta TaxID=6216 RepID=A0A564Y8R9_HYMDI|nr:unnamed protein product [Hymenolepis diminuta]
MGTVATILKWIVRVENGGLLNIAFEKVSTTITSETEFDVSKDLMGKTIDFAKRALMLKEIPLPILKEIPESLGGGKAGVDDAHSHPNREPVLFFITIGVFLAVVILQFASCCCLGCGIKKSKKNRKTKNYGSFGRKGEEEILENLITEESPETHSKRRIHRIVYLIVLALGVTFLAASVILTIIYFSSTALVVNYLETKPEKPSEEIPLTLPDGLRITREHMAKFFNRGITMGKKQTSDSIDALLRKINGEMSSQINMTVDNILIHLEVGQVLQKGKETLANVDKFKVYTSKIASNIKTVKIEITDLRDSMKITKQEFDDAYRTSPNCQAPGQCDQLKKETNKIICPIEPDAINTDSTDQLITHLNTMQMDLQNQMNDIEKAIADIHGSTENIVDSVQKQINLDSTMKPIDQFWDDANKMSKDIMKNLDDTIGTVEEELPKYLKFIRIGFYILGGVFIFMLIIAALIAVHLIFRALTGHIFSSSKFNDAPKIKKDICGQGPICCCSILFIPILLMLAIITAVLLFSMTLVSGEGCIYVVRESAISKADFVMNGYIAHLWKSMMEGDGLGDAGEFLNLKSPRNILYALNNVCARSTVEHGVGLLRSVGYDNLVDVEKLVESNQVADGINQGRESLIDQIKQLDVPSQLPRADELDNMQKQLNEAFDKVDIKELLKISHPDQLNIMEFKNLHSNLKTALASDPTFIKPIDSLEGVIQQMEKLKKSLTDTHEAMKKSETHVEDMKKVVAETITVLKITISKANDEQELLGKVAGEYDVMTNYIIEFIKNYGDKLFMRLTQVLLPCQDAHIAYAAVTKVSCGDSGGISLLLGLVYVLALNVLFIALVYITLFNLAYAQARLIHLVNC